MIYRVDIEFTEPMLGGAPLRPEIYSKFILPKKQDPPLTQEEVSEELESLPEDERGITGFHRDEKGRPFVYNYTWKGYFKESCGFLRNIATTESKGLTNYKKRIDGLLFVFPRVIPMVMTGDMSINTRPLRAQTMQGERITIASSEQVPLGTTMSFEILSLADSIMTRELISEWLFYGFIKGYGQWRNASWGTFIHTIEEVKEPQWTPKLPFL